MSKTENAPQMRSGCDASGSMKSLCFLAQMEKCEGFLLSALEMSQRLMNCWKACYSSFQGDSANLELREGLLIREKREKTASVGFALKSVRHITASSNPPFTPDVPVCTESEETQQPVTYRCWSMQWKELDWTSGDLKQSLERMWWGWCLGRRMGWNTNIIGQIFCEEILYPHIYQWVTSGAKRSGQTGGAPWRRAYYKV